MNILSEELEVMVDLETMSTRPNASIIAIGAVTFNKHGVLEEFYEKVDLSSSIDIGLHVDGETVMWWLKQSEEARKALSGGTIELAAALYAFSVFLPENCKLWGNGANFDNPILTSAYNATNMSLPWNFWNDRCLRTVKDIFNHVPPDDFIGTQHNALDDAKNQALHLIKINNGV